MNSATTTHRRQISPATNRRSVMQKTAKNVKKHWFLYLLVSVPLLYTFIFKYIPMIGIQIAFKNYRVTEGIFGSKWVGLQHFKAFFSSPNFADILLNTLGLSVYSLAVSFPLAILLAIMVNEVSGTRFKKTVQMVTYAPYFISTVVLVAMLMEFTSIRGGLINNIIGVFGIEPINFFGESTYFKSLYVWSSIWQTMGYSSIIYIAALAGVDPTLYEAATIDGASRLQKIVYVDIPSILPTAIILLIVNAGQIMNVGFEKVFLMQTPLNLDASEIIATYAYKIGMVSGQFSFSTAIDLFNSVINLILLVTLNKISRKAGETSLW